MHTKNCHTIFDLCFSVCKRCHFVLSRSQDHITNRENNLTNHNNCKYYSFINHNLTFVLYTHEFYPSLYKKFHHNIVPPLFGCYWSYLLTSMHVYMLLCVLQMICLLNHVTYHRIPCI